MRPTKRDPERVLRWGFALSLAATFALAVAYLVVESGHRYENVKAIPSWIVLRSEVATAGNLALLAAFVFLAAAWYRRGRARSALSVSAPRVGVACILAGVVLGALGHLAFSSLLEQGRFEILNPSDQLGIALDALMLFSIPLVALGFGLMTFARAPRVPPPPPEDAAAPDGRNP